MESIRGIAMARGPARPGRSPPGAGEEEESVRIRSMRTLLSPRRHRRASAAVPLEPLESRVFLAANLPAAADTFVRDGDLSDVNFGAADRLHVRRGDSDVRRI